MFLSICKKIGCHPGKTNCIEDWETKVDAIVEETLPENMTIISGIPSWVQMYFERLQQKTGKKVGEVSKTLTFSSLEA